MEINQSQDNSDSLSARIQGELSKLPSIYQNRCIYKIPENLCQVGKRAYLPRIVSIGPYHHKVKRLLPMEEHKLRYLKSFLVASGCNDKDKLCYVNKFLGIVKDKESEIRKCYSDARMIKLSSDEFNRMVLIDSAFIIMILRQEKDMKEHKKIEGNDPIYGRPYKIYDVRRDIMLAENQLPFFILEELYEAAFKRDMNSWPSFTEIAFGFLGIEYNKDKEKSTICHLLHLSQTRYKPSKPKQTKATLYEKLISTVTTFYEKVISPTDTPSYEQIINPTVNTSSEVVIEVGESRSGDQGPGSTDTRSYEENNSPTATTMHEAGIKFQRPDSSSGSLLDIEFDRGKGVLTIPKLVVNDKTEDKFRNLAAFEQCHDKNHRWVSDYIFFMDCVINTPTDVDLLVQEHLIDNFLGSSQEVSDLFNSLGKNLISSAKYQFGGKSQELNNYCKKPWNRYKTILKHTYFSHPWAVISVVYAVILLILTLISTVTGIISVV